MTILDHVVETSWAGPMLWAVLYVSDHGLTLAGARRYRIQENIVFEGSYEITPMFQAEVDALRGVSPRFLAMLLMSTAYLWLVRGVAGPSTLYIVVLGAMVLVEGTVHMRHLRNWFLFAKGAGVFRGQITYPRRLLLTMSAFELLLFAGLYASLFAVTGSAFILGGSLACGVLSLNHYRLARRERRSAASVAA